MVNHDEEAVTFWTLNVSIHVKIRMMIFTLLPTLGPDPCRKFDLWILFVFENRFENYMSKSISKYEPDLICIKMKNMNENKQYCDTTFSNFCQEHQ